jgi:predicted permease
VIDVLWQVIAPIFLAAGAGYVLARRLGLTARQLSRVAFYLFSPCLLFDRLSHTTLSATDLGQIALFATLAIAGAALLGWIVARLMRYGRTQTLAFVLVVMAGNTGNYGLAANQFAFGVQALEPALVYFAISSLAISTVGVYLVASGRRTAIEAARNVLAVPLFYATIAGLAVWALHLQLPAPIERSVSLLGQAAVPVMLVVLGMQLAGVRLRSDLGRIFLAALTKMVGGALIGLALASLLSLSGVTRQSAILQSAMPTAVMATILAGEYDVEQEFTAGVVLVSTLASIVTITALLTFLG